MSTDTLPNRVAAGKLAEDRAVPRPVAPQPGDELPAYLPWLDVLRFLACFLVIVLHCMRSAPAALGHAGVALFFSISGFLIGRVLMQSRDLKVFYARRFLRIYPAYLATLLIFAALTVTPVMHDPESGRLFWHNLQYYLTFTFQLSPDSSRLPLLIVWSLCVEEVFYLVLPIIFLLGKRTLIAAALVVIAGILLVPRFYLLPNGEATWYLFPFNLLTGVGLALWRPRLRSLFPFVALVAIGLLLANVFTNWFQSFGPVSAVLCTATVWSLAVYSKPLPRLFTPFQWMGKLSYGIYLLHLLCISVAVRVLAKLGNTSILAIVALVLLTTAISVLVAWLLQICVEDPALSLRRYLKTSPAFRNAVAALQVSLIPLGIILAILRHRQ